MDLAKTFKLAKAYSILAHWTNSEAKLGIALANIATAFIPFSNAQTLLGSESVQAFEYIVKC